MAIPIKTSHREGIIGLFLLIEITSRIRDMNTRSGIYTTSPKLKSKKRLNILLIDIYLMLETPKKTIRLVVS
jgi:hypothetical protein